MSAPEPLETIELETAPSPTAAVIWLHGLGADGYDFVPIVEELALPKALAVRFVFPHAPMRAVTINRGAVMRAWYDIAEASGTRQEDEAGVRASQTQVETLIARQIGRGIPAARIVLAGFSQGGAIALQTALRYHERLAGVMALSTYLPLAHTLAGEASAANHDVPILMAHGGHDSVIAIAWALRSRDLLRKAGYQVEWHDYEMPHAVCAEELVDITAWLARVLRSG